MQSATGIINSQKLHSWLNSTAYWWIELICAAVLLLLVWSAGILKISFHVDESYFITTSNFFEAFSNPADGLWQENYDNLLVPPLPRYLIGFGRQLAGIPASQIGPAWDFSLDEAANAAAGNIPSPNLLYASRMPMVLLTVLSGTIFFGMVRFAAGRLAGWAFLVLFCSPYFLDQLTRAMAEAPLTAFTAASIVCALIAINQDGKNEIGRYSALFGMGVCIGLAGASKLTGLANIFAGLCIVSILAYRAPRGHRITFFIRGISLVVFTTLIIFVLVNPYLYPNPLGNMARLLKFRYEAQVTSPDRYPELDISNLTKFLTNAPGVVLGKWLGYPFTGSPWVYAVLAIVGNVTLVRRIWRGNPASLGLLFFLFPLALTAFFALLLWDRYFLFLVLYLLIGASAGVVTVGKGIWQAFGRMRRGNYT